MKPEEIKKRINTNNKLIKYLKENNVILRTICKHEKTHEGMYCERIGMYFNAEICNCCGEIIKNLDIPKIEIK